jgi:hypothetical protein
MGQCFSSSKVGVAHVPTEQITTIPDIIRNNYTFSDGVGKISHSLAMKVSKAQAGLPALCISGAILAHVVADIVTHPSCVSVLVG